MNKTIQSNIRRRNILLKFVIPLLGGTLGLGGCKSLEPIPDSVLKVHREAIVADLHVDPLFWNVPLETRTEDMQVDLPRMREGQVDIAIFGIVSSGLPVINGFGLLTWLHGWPRAARKDHWTAAQYQLDRLDALVAATKGQLLWARTARDVERAQEEGKIALFAGVEGAQALEGDVGRVQELYDRGVLYMGPVHLAGNELGGASYPIGNRGGLSDYGRRVLAEMERLGMFIDLAHLSQAAFREVIERSKGPVLCSHTGIYEVEHSWRNLRDDQLRAIAERGGVIGVMLATNFLGGRSVRRWVEHVKHAVEVAGIDHVALGSDFDGFIPVPREVPDVSALGRLTEALLDTGFSEEEVRKIMGGNFYAMLKRFRP